MTENMTPEEVVAAALALGPDGDGTDPSDWGESAAHVVASLRDANLSTLTHSHTCVTVPTISELADHVQQEGRPIKDGNTPTTEQVAHAYCDGLAGTSRTREESDAEFRAWLQQITVVNRDAVERALAESLNLIGTIWREWSAEDLAKFIAHETAKAIAATHDQEGTQ